MTAQEFIAEICKSGSPITIEEQEISHKIRIVKDLKAEGIIIKNCTFEENVLFHGIDLGFGIEFIDCNFKKAIEFASVKVEKEDLFLFGRHAHISFINSKINNLSFKGKCIINRGLYIGDKSEIQDFTILKEFTTNEDIKINDSTINNSFVISNSQPNRIVIENNSIINCPIILENLKSYLVLFQNSIFNNNIILWGSRSQKVALTNCVFSNQLEFNSVTISDRLTIKSSEFKDSLILNLRDEVNNRNGRISKIFISTTKFSDQFIINGENSEVEDITIVASKKLEGSLNFNNLNIVETKISGDISNCNLIFNQCKLNNLSFNHCYNYGTIPLNTIESYKVDTSINITNSNLGKTHLFNTSLNSFDFININNSFLMDIISANVNWFSDDRLNSDKKEELNFFDQKREIYRQLKYALDKQGDRITALKFKAMEMEAYKNHAFLNKTKIAGVSVFDRFILWLSQINDYGINWFKPTLFAIGLSILFHFLITIGVSDNLSFKPNCSDGSLITTWEIYFANLYTLPQLMNPVHNLSHIYPKLELSFTVHFFDYLLKLILAFLIFQIISAFRKYIK